MGTGIAIGKLLTKQPDVFSPRLPLPKVEECRPEAAGAQLTFSSHTPNTTTRFSEVERAASPFDLPPRKHMNPDPSGLYGISVLRSLVVVISKIEN